ncbi:MAG: carbohydrate-binding domain-containing protein [Clostridiales Family XIII bacterium]|nr:carbohydrate-binding domain-containing protein [Clostridiales Family XIII bacterium]
MKKLIMVLSLIFVITFALAGCGGNAGTSAAETGGAGSAPSEDSGSGSGAKTPADSADNDTDNSNNNDDDGDEEDVVPAKTISEDGEYTLTGEINGQVLVTAEKVTLILDDATINCPDASAILGKDGNGSKVEQELVIELRGESTVTSGAKHGIQGKDDLTITGSGAVNIFAVKDGLHAGETLTVAGGIVNVTQSYEGMEATNLVISGGTSTVYATDDGINATDDTGKVTPSIRITDGTLIVYCTSDGIDSNGTLEISDAATVAIFIGETRDGDATDTDRGGTIPPTLYGAAAIKAGTKIEVGDLWSFTPAADVRTFGLMIPGLVNGQSYEIKANGAALTTVTATTTLQGMMMGGGGGFARNDKNQKMLPRQHT